MAAEFFDRRLQSSLRDNTWVKKTFMYSATDFVDIGKVMFTMSTAKAKAIDTKIGGNITLNNPPQYCRYADPRISGLLAHQRQSGGTTVDGPGHYWNDAFDDNKIVLRLQMGTPRFTGMVSFFTGFYDADAARASREARAGFWGAVQDGIESVTYMGGKILGALIALPALPFFVASTLIRFALNRTSSRYYSFSPSMHTYWTRVNWIANALAANRGLVPRAGSFCGYDLREGQGFEKDELPQSVIEYAHRVAPDIFRKEGGVDIYALGNRYARINNLRLNKLASIAGDTEADLSSQQLLDNVLSFLQDRVIVSDPGAETLESYVTRAHKSVLGNLEYATDSVEQRAATVLNADASQTIQAGKPAPTQAPVDAGTEGQAPRSGTGDFNIVPDDPNRAEFYARWIQDKTDPTKWNVQQGLMSKLGDHMTADFQRGSAYMCLAVEPLGAGTWSWSNQLVDSELGGRINGLSSAANVARFNFQDGATGVAPIDGVIGALKSFASGVLDGVQLSGIMALAGGALVDIPKHWQSSSVSFPTQSFSITIPALYGNPLYLFLQQDIIISAVLAMALPISTGKQSYTSPFLVSSFVRGQQRIRCGMVTDLSITRGVGNIPVNNEGQALGITITFTVADTSNAFHMPINDGYKLLQLPYKGVFDDDNIANDFLATVANMSFEDQTFASRRLAINLSRYFLNRQAYFSSSHLSSAMGNSALGDLAGRFFAEASR